MAKRLIAPSIGYRVTGDITKLTKKLDKMGKMTFVEYLEKCGEKGVAALRESTPRDTGKTAESWSYKIRNYKNGIVRLSWYNSNTNRTISIALLVQYGHMNKRGGWVEGVDYINPALKPVFEEMVKNAWKGVTEV